MSISKKNSRKWEYSRLGPRYWLYNTRNRALYYNKDTTLSTEYLNPKVSLWFHCQSCVTCLPYLSTEWVQVAKRQKTTPHRKIKDSLYQAIPVVRSSPQFVLPPSRLYWLYSHYYNIACDNNTCHSFPGVKESQSQLTNIETNKNLIAY